MKAAHIWRLAPALLAASTIWAFATRAQAQFNLPPPVQLATGCACLAGSTPVSGTTCTRSLVAVVPIPAICPGRNVGSIAASQQQQSFWGIQQMLTAKRDQIQATPTGGASPKFSGYAASFSDDGHLLGYDGQSQKSNPLASPLYDAAPAVAAAENPVWGVWIQGLGDWEHDNALSTADAAHATTIFTGQAGLDRTFLGVLNADDAFVAGLVSSWTNARVGYDGTPISLHMSGPGIGLYTQYIRGGFSADVTTKFDFLQLDEDFGGLAPNSSVSVLNAGVSGNSQYKFTGDNNNFFEPTWGFSLTHTGFGPAGPSLNLEDAYTVRLQAGARVGTTWDLGHGVTLDGSLKALVYGDAVAQGTSIAGATSLTPSISPSDTGLVRGEFDPELSFNLPDNYSLTLSGQYRTGKALSGGSAGVNLRKAW